MEEPLTVNSKGSNPTLQCNKIQKKYIYIYIYINIQY